MWNAECTTGILDLCKNNYEKAIDLSREVLDIVCVVIFNNMLTKVFHDCIMRRRPQDIKRDFPTFNTDQINAIKEIVRDGASLKSLDVSLLLAIIRELSWENENLPNRLRDSLTASGALDHRTSNLKQHLTTLRSIRNTFTHKKMLTYDKKKLKDKLKELDTVFGDIFVELNVMTRGSDEASLYSACLPIACDEIKAKLATLENVVIFL